MARPRGKKRTAATDSSKPEAAAKELAKRGRGKRVRAPAEPAAEYFPEKRNLVRGCNGESKLVLIPVIIAVDCPFPPSDKIGINSVQRENEEIVPMKAMKMAWIPYVPLEDRLSRIDSLRTKIFTLGCTQRRSVLKHLKTERVKKFDYCMPYYMPLQPVEDEDDTVINFLYPQEPPIVDDFDWEVDEYEDFADQKVKDEILPEDEKVKFKEFLKEKVRERKRELKQAKDARKKAIDDMDPKEKDAFENIKFYKFYPVKPRTHQMLTV